MAKPGLHLVDDSSVQFSRTGAHEDIPAPLRRICANALSDAMGVHRMTSSQLSPLVGVTRQRVDRWQDPEDEQWMSAPRLLMAARHPRGQAVALTYLAALRGHIGDEPEPVSVCGQSLLARTFEALADVGRLADDTRRALADQVVTDEERVQLLRDAQMAMAHLLTLTRELQKP
jgi:hypothetical protein